MSIAQALLPEFDQEMANTRKMLELVPEDKPGFQPDPKSMTLARLAGHVAELPGWGTTTMTSDSLDTSSFAGMKPGEMTTRAALLATFDKNVTTARAAIAAGSDADMMKDWSLTGGGHTFVKLPKAAVLRSFMMSHLIHHRAQLGVYLRMTGVAIPGMYGPSADEPNPFASA